jgi:hypothetical protein
MHPEVIIVPALFIMIGFVIWVVASAWQRRLRMKLTAEFNSKLLDRIGSVKDFNEFLHTEGGAKFMDSLTIERTASRPQAGILRASQIGIVALTLGLGVLSLGRYFSVRHPGSEDFEGLTVIGTIAVSLGVGFLISALASYRLARILGVVDTPGYQGTGHQGSADLQPR